MQVAETGSFSRAGQRLNYSQPTVSFQIKQLERELGVQLFERVGHNVSLTDDGRAALVYAQQICRLQQEMASGPSRRNEACGIVRFATADSLCTPLIAQEFAQFRQDYPNVSLRLTTGETGELFRLLDHNEVDLICALDSHVYNTAYIICEEEKIDVHFVAAASNPICSRANLTIQDLLSEPFVLTEKDMSYGRLFHERLAMDAIEIHPILETGNTDLICALVEQGMGISYLPDYATQAAVNKGALRRLAVEGFEIDLWKQLVYRRDKWVSLQMQALISHLSKIKLQA